MKKKVIIISIILLIIISLITCYFLFFNNTLVKFSTNKIEINKQVYNTDLVISLRNGKILSDKEQLDTSKLGTYNINIKIKEVFNKEKEYNVTYEVVDTTPPVITYNKEITTSIGKKIDLLKNISAEDNSKEDIEVTTEGDYNINKEGTYDIYYIAKDSSNNIAKEKATLKVTNNNNNNTDDIVMMEDNTFTTKNGFEGYTKNGLTYINGILIANKTYYLPSNYAPGLNSEVKEKAQEMFNDAAKKRVPNKTTKWF